MRSQNNNKLTNCTIKIKHKIISHFDEPIYIYAASMRYQCSLMNFPRNLHDRHKSEPPQNNEPIQNHKTYDQNHTYTNQNVNQVTGHLA